MTKLLTLTAAAFAASAIVSTASATTFTFKGDGGAHDTPLGGNAVNDCGTVGTDICSDDDSLGLTYGKDGIWINVKALNNSTTAATLIQDIQPYNSGLGVLSAGESGNDDQVQASTSESLLFTSLFGEIAISNIEFNGGHDGDCTPVGSEGECGTFNLVIDGVLSAANTGLTAVNLLAMTFVGTTFEFIATGDDTSGFVIAQFDVEAVPLPGALPLLLSGLAGLGFAARRKKAAA